MERVAKQMATADKSAGSRDVLVFVNSSLFILSGSWEWELFCENVFCSDVIISAPGEFQGVRGVIFPDDRNTLVSLAREEKISRLEFRIITTYGEVKNLVGSNLDLIEPTPDLALDLTQKLIEIASKDRQHQLNSDRFYLQKEAVTFSEQLSRAGTFYINTITGETWYSDMVFRIFGLLPQSLNANRDTFLRFIHPDDGGVVVPVLEKAYKDELPIDIEFRVIGADTKVRDIQYTTRWLSSTNGERIVTGVIKDVTLQKEIEQDREHLMNDVQFQREVMAQNEEILASGNCYINLLTRKFSYSDNFYRIYGLRRQAIIESSVSFSNQVHSDDRDLVRETERKIIMEHAATGVEFRIIRPDGSVRWIRQKSKLLIYARHEMIMVIGIQDITRQKQNTERLLSLFTEKEAIDNVHHHTEEISGIGHWVWDLRTGQISFSQNLYRMFGYKPGNAELTRKSLLRLVHPDDQHLFNTAVGNMIETQTEDAFVFRVLRAGLVRHFKASFKLFDQKDQKLFLGILMDVTEETLMNRRLLDNIHFLDGVNANIADMIMVTDINYNIIEWNSKCEAGFNLKKAEVLNKNFFDVFPKLKTDIVFQSFRKVLNGEAETVTHSTTPYLKGYYDFYLAPLRDSAEKVTGILHVIHDLTKEVVLQKTLTERITFIENLVESSVSRIIVMDKNLNYLYWNKKCEEYYGLKKEQVIGRNILDVFSGIQNSPAYTDFRKVLKGDELHIPASTGNSLDDYSDTHLIPLKNEKGEVFGVLWIVYDQTDKILAEEKTREATHLLHETAQATPDCIMVYDLENKQPLFVTSRLAQWVGYTDDELMELGFDGRLHLFHVDDRQKILAFNEAMLSAADEEVRAIEYRLHTRDGKTFWVRNRCKVFRRNAEGRVTQVLSVLQDISAQKLAEEKLLIQHFIDRQSERIADIGNWQWNLTTGQFTWGDNMYRLLNYEPNEFVPDMEMFLKSMHPDDREEFTKITGAMQGLDFGTLPVFEFRVAATDGSVRYLRLIGSIMEKESERIAIGVAQDITKVKMAEENLVAAMDELAMQNKIYEHAETIASIGTWTWNADTGKAVYSDNMFALFGLQPGEVEPDFSNIPQFIHPDDRPRILQAAAALKKEGESSGSEYRVIRKDGQERIFRNRLRLVRSERNERLFIGTTQDITEHKLIEQELQKANEALYLKNTELKEINEEMSSFAFMSSHELREPLGVIEFFTSKVIKEDDTISDSARNYLRKSVAAIKKMDKIINDILSLSRASIRDTKDSRVDLNLILEQVLTELQPQISASQAKVVCQKLPLIDGAPVQYFQLLKNLISNGIKFQQADSVPTIEINGKISEGRSQEIAPFTASKKFLHLSVRDNGVGFDMKHSKKIFNLFERLYGSYEYPGSGIGLTICKKIIDHLKGTITVESEPGKGSVFHCYIPVNGRSGD